MSSAFAWITSAVPPLREDRVAVIAHRHSWRDHRRLAGSIRADREIRHVAGVRAFRILQSVMLHVRVKMAAGRGERRAFAFRDRVHVNGVLARRKIHQVEFNVHALRCRRKFRRADALSLGVVELYLDRLRGRGNGQ